MIKAPTGRIKAIYITFNGITDPLGQSQVLTYIKDLAKYGITFYLISLEKNIKEAEKISESMAGLGIIWYRLQYFKFYFFGMALNVLQCFFLVIFLIISKKPDIIHARAYPPMFSVFLLKKFFNIKIIFDIRGFWPEQLADTEKIKSNSIYYKILKFLEKKSMLSSDYVVTLTPESKEIIEEKFKIKNVMWMPTCVDDDKFNQPADDKSLAGRQESVSFVNKFIMIYSGSLWSFYDAPAMIDFFKALKLKITNAHFLILGNNETERLQGLFIQKGVQKEDYTIDKKASGDVPKYLSSSNLGISFRYDFYSEKASFPTKLAEYLASGLPVVINSKSDYIKKLVNSNKVGVVLDEFDKESLTKAVNELLILMEDKSLKQRCVKIAQEYLSKRVCVNKYINIYNELQKL